jgi:hypothetical protein
VKYCRLNASRLEEQRGYLSSLPLSDEPPGFSWRDADGYDLEQDQRWEHVDPSGYYPLDLFPARTDAGAVRGVADRGTNP